MLRGDGKGGFTPVDMERSNLVIDGQVRDIKSLRGAKGERLIVVARNNDKVVILRQERATAASTRRQTADR
jgi:hypothetical protein